MKTSILLITISGEDRPGIVGEVAARVHEHGGNWEKSRLIHLAGRFVGLLQVSVPEEHREALRKDLLSISGLEMTVAFGRDKEIPSTQHLQLSLLGADHSGIVREIFHAIAKLGLNVESLSTLTEPAADSGTLLFRADARLSTAEPLPVATIQDALEALAHDLQVDLTVKQPE